MKICFYKNFDDVDDFHECNLPDNSSPYMIGGIILKMEREGWRLDLDDMSLADKIYYLSCKSDYQITQLQDTLNNFIGTIEQED